MLFECLRTNKILEKTNIQIMFKLNKKHDLKVTAPPFKNALLEKI